MNPWLVFAALCVIPVAVGWLVGHLLFLYQQVATFTAASKKQSETCRHLTAAVVAQQQRIDTLADQLAAVRRRQTWTIPTEGLS